VREGAGFPGPGVMGGGGGISGPKRVRKGAWEGLTGQGRARMCGFKSNKPEYASKRRVCFPVFLLSMLKMFPAPRFEVSARDLATNPCFLGHPGTILMNNTWIGLSNLP